MKPITPGATRQTDRATPATLAEGSGAFVPPRVFDL
jgi:hypothetical protein